MRKALALTFVCALFSMLGSGTALAAPGDTGNACPPNSPKGEGAPPCGPGDRGNQGNDGDRGNQGDGGDRGDRGEACPPSSPKGGGDPPCGNAGNGGNGGNGGGQQPEPPEGNCESADLVVLEDAKLVCLFLGENADQATKEEDCPDAVLATGPIVPDTLGACVFLPPPEEN